LILKRSTDSYSYKPSTLFIEVSPYVLDIRVRREKNRASSDYKLALKQVEVSREYDIQTILYGYDALARLQTADYYTGTLVDGTPQRQYAYNYDRASNRTRRQVWLNGVADSDVPYTYNGANQLTSDGVNSYTYDTNGNLISNGTDTYTWDRENRLLTFGGSSYEYNGLGQRVKQTVNSIATQYLLDVQPGLYKVLAATTGSNTDRYIHDPMGIAQHEDYTGNWHFLTKDGLGTVRHVYDHMLDEVYAVERDPYGELIADSGTNPTPFEYTGEPLDENGLLHLRARYYDPRLGVFASLDPLETTNRYGYVDGNPITFTDPTGRFPCILGIECDDEPKFGNECEGVSYGGFAIKDFEPVQNPKLYLAADNPCPPNDITCVPWPIHPSDPNQGYLNNCSFVTSLAALSYSFSGPNKIFDAITDNEDGTYDVTLYQRQGRGPFGLVGHKYNTTTITVTPQKPIFLDANNGCTRVLDELHMQIDDMLAGQNEVWALVLENAYAYWLGNGDMKKGYLLLHFPELQSGRQTASPVHVFEALTGVDSVEYKTSEITFDEIVRMYERGYAITFSSLDGDPNVNLYYGTYQLVVNHEYYLVGIDAEQQTLTLRHPWEWNDTNMVTIPYEEIDNNFRRIRANPIDG
jgi:RHS repeat-associated protein